MSRKIQINSLYGVLGNQYFRHYRLDNAGITLTGQVSIRWIERKVNGFCNKALKTEGKDYVIAYLTLTLSTSTWVTWLTRQSPRYLSREDCGYPESVL